jgi:hypothetical protein
MYPSFRIKIGKNTYSEIGENTYLARETRRLKIRVIELMRKLFIRKHRSAMAMTFMMVEANNPASGFCNRRRANSGKREGGKED